MMDPEPVTRPDGDASHAPDNVDVDATMSSTPSVSEREAARKTLLGIMSNTVNGCLMECGYFPGIRQLLQERQNENMILREQNQKLHTDNVALSRIVNLQKEQIAMLASPHPENSALDRDQEVRKLRKQFEACMRDREQMARANQHLQMSCGDLQREMAQLVAWVQKALPGRLEIVPPGMAPMQFPMAGYQPQVIPDNPGLFMPPFSMQASGAINGASPGAQGDPRAPPPIVTNGHVPTPPIPSPMMNHFQSLGPPLRFINQSMANVSISYHNGRDSRPPSSAASSAPHSQPPTPLSATPVLLPSALPARRPSMPTVMSPAIGQPMQGSFGPVAPDITHAIVPIPVVPSQSMHSGLSVASSPASLNSSAPPRADVIDLTADAGESRDSVHDGPRKKRRVDDAGDVKPTEAQPHVDPQQVAAPATSPVQPTDVTGVEGEEEPPATETEEGDAEEEDDSLDADGRRSIEACIQIAFEDKDGALWCTMCQLRFRKGLTVQQPTAFLDATVEELARHCENEHPAGWETLRGPSHEV